MTVIDPGPLPAGFTFPGGTEPFTDQDLEAFDFLAMARHDELRMTDPEEVVTEFLEIEAAVVPDRWVVDDDGKAEWVARKLAQLEAEATEDDQRADGWVAEIERWRREQQRPREFRRALYEGWLNAYMAEVREASGDKVKSRKLPSATLKSTGSGPKAVVADEAAVIAWADENLEGDDLAEVVKTERSVRVSNLRKVAAVSQELLGVRLVVDLECGHGLELFRPADAVEPPTPLMAEGDHPADRIPCSACEADFDGEAPRRAVQLVEAVEVYRPVVRDEENGDIIPGAEVSPARVEYRVVVNRG